MTGVRLISLSSILLAAAQPAALVRAPAPPPAPFGALEPNQGQALPEILFLKRGADGVAVTADGVRFATLGARQRLVGANTDAGVRFLDVLPGVVHSLSGGNPAQWVTGLPRYRAALLEDRRPGVDVRYEIDAEGRLVQRLLLDPGVDPETIVFEVPSAQQMEVEPDGRLRVDLTRFTRPPGPRLTFPAPSAVQNKPLVSVALDARFVALSSTRYVMTAEGRDASLPLQMTLILSGATESYGVARSATSVVAEDGSTLVAVSVPDAAGKPAPFPETDWAGCGVNFYTPIPCTDIVVYKHSPGGELVFATYLEGRTSEYAVFLDTAPDGSVVVAGNTDSRDFPTSPASLQPDYGGPDPVNRASRGAEETQGDFFAARLDSRTGEATDATFVGGPFADQMGTAELGSDGSLYFLHKWLGRRTGEMPTSPAALMPECPDPCGQGYAARLAPALDRLLYGTYLPGNIQATAELHSDGSIYYVGNAEAGFPVTPTAYQQEPVGGVDGIAARLDPLGEKLLFATYIGGPDTETILRMALAPDGSVWAAMSSYVQCCIDIRSRLIRLDANGEKILADPAIDVGDIQVGADGALRAIVQQDLAISPDAFLAHSCPAKLGYVELSPNGVQLFASYLPAGTYYDFAGTDENGLPLVTVAGENFRVVRERKAGIYAGCVVDAASFSENAPTPGQIVTLFGSGLGPDEGASFELVNGRVPTEVAGVRVLIDGTPAPILFASYWQVNAIVPYSLPAGARPSVVVEYAGRTTDPLPGLYVERAAVSLFRRNESPDRPAAALNQDGTVNTADNPAEPGSVVVLFGTGGGTTVPPSEAGEATPLELRVLEETPMVRVYASGGQELAVEFAGAAPGLVAGVTQINVRLPDEIPEVEGFRPNLLPLQINTPGFSYASGWVTVAVGGS